MKDVDDILRKLKDLINEDEKKNWIAMCLLSCVVKSIDKELFEENALLWLKSTMMTINSAPSESLFGLCCEVLIEIITRSFQIDKISREISTRAVESLLALLLSM